MVEWATPSQTSVHFCASSESTVLHRKSGGGPAPGLRGPSANSYTLEPAVAPACRVRDLRCVMRSTSKAVSARPDMDPRPRAHTSPLLLSFSLSFSAAAMLVGKMLPRL